MLYVVTHGLTVRHLLAGQMAWLRARGLDVAVACAPGPELDEAVEREGVRAFRVPMAREIAPVADLVSVARLARVIRRWRPHVVNAGTPKAGLLGMLAARLADVPVRIYTLRGLRLETTAGSRRFILTAAERMTSACAHEVIAVSRSLASRYVACGLASAAKVRVLGYGASNGIDPARLAVPPRAVTIALRERLAIPVDAPVIGFAGRFTRDKGIVELVDAFERVRARIPQARLLLVGDFEQGDPVPDATTRAIRGNPAIVLSGFVGDTAPYYHAMDVLAFPSHREGFPNVPLEAAAAGVPVVGFRATGTVDAVVAGETGTLVDVGDVAGLADGILRYLLDPELRRNHGAAGKERVEREFLSERIWQALLEDYDRLLAAAGTPRSAVAAVTAEPGSCGGER
jgi:glycosyltransferase involved in cell wall biosynthesis